MICRTVLALSAALLATGGVPRADRSGAGRLVATGQVVAPAGQSLAFGGRPVDLVLSPDGRRLYVKNMQGVVVIDAVRWRIVQELPYPAGGASMHGIALSRDGRRLYVTTAQDSLHEAAVGSDGRLAWARRIGLPGPGGRGDSHACGIALTPDGHRAYVCLSRNNALGVVDLQRGTLVRQIPVGVAPWDVALMPGGRTACVSDWGGRRPRPGDRTEKSSGTDTVVDTRGVASTGSVSFVDLALGREARQVATGLHPCDLALSADARKLYVANANSDSVTVIDTVARRARGTLQVQPDASLPSGSAPTGLVLSRDGRTLYVALGGSNAVAVVPLGARRHGSPHAASVAGCIPAGWYPGAVATDGRRLFIANVKGSGAPNRPASAQGFNSHQHLGTVTRVPIPSSGELRAYTARSVAGARVAQALQARQAPRPGRHPVPVPERVGEPSVFEHVVYVIKENRTYDQVFGDLPQGNGDPRLCVFGREVSPNHHALAEQFVLLDNFYCNGVLSADGHSWATEGNVTDHLEKSFGGFTRSYTWGDDPLTYSSSGFIWDAVLDRGLSFRNYGEMDYAEPEPAGDFTAVYRDWQAKGGRFAFKQSIGIARLRRNSCRRYPGWNTGVPDVLRADVFLRELRELDATGTLSRLTIVYLGNDHTTGTAAGYPTPRAQVADNDLALGRVVDGLTHSRFWPKTCIFVVEDDPQDGFDHVDGHRSPCLVVSPYTRRGAVVSSFYNQTSVLHTMERILGLPAMNQMDALAPVMDRCFTGRPDLRAYTVLPNRIALDEMNPAPAALNGPARRWALRCAALDLKRPDRADEDTLNRAIWHSVRGQSSAYPSHLAGAHGRGLRALGLRLARRGGAGRARSRRSSVMGAEVRR